MENYRDDNGSHSVMGKAFVVVLTIAAIGGFYLLWGDISDYFNLASKVKIPFPE